MLKHKLLKLVAVLAFTTFPATAMASQYLVKFRPVVSMSEARSKLAKAGFKVLESYSEIGVLLTTPSSREQERHLVASLKKSRDVLYVEKDEERWRAEGVAFPLDPLYVYQYALKQIEAPAAWDFTTGSRDVIVAVVDTGVSLNHPDLRNQLWKNPGEIAGNGIDDDGNGYVDDLHGWNFKDGNNNPDDGNGHGTHVAGIIGAEANNAQGVAGVAWKVRILAAQFLGANGSGSDSNGLKAILYAAKAGARVINCSWGSDSTSRALEEAIQYAFSVGSVVISAAGNDGRDTDVKPHYPSNSSPVSVAAADSSSLKASFSNHGPRTVHLAAPGVAVLATYTEDAYEYLSGTSMATPVVSGVAALMLAQRPGLSALELRNGLYNAITPRMAFARNTSTGGEINARKAVEQLVSTAAQVWPALMTVPVGSKFQLNAFNAGGALTWSVSNAAVASISDTGELSAKKTGTVTVTARSAATRAVVGSAEITILEPSARKGS